MYNALITCDEINVDEETKTILKTTIWESKAFFILMFFC